MTSCPQHDRLEALVEERLAEAERVALEAHVETCLACQAVLDSITRAEFATTSAKQGSEPERTSLPPQRWNGPLLDRLADAVRREVDRDSSEPPSRHDPLPEISGYTISAQIGRGGMGAVYRATQERLRRDVALKVLPADRLHDEDAIARFDREMQAVGQLNHANIVVAHDAGEIKGQLYLVMELVDGIDLATLLRAGGKLEVADACEMIRQAALGLAHAHKRGLIHRDLKPSNLMLAANDDGPPLVKILDLGLALLGEQHQDGELTSASQMMGTLEYMAPEQGLDSHAVDARADVYSLGATLYKLLCGETPFPKRQYDTPLKLVRALASETPSSIGEKRKLPAPLIQLVDRMLAREPDGRPDSAQEVAEALAPFAEGHNLAALLERAQREAGTAPFEADEAATPKTPEAFIDTRSTVAQQVVADVAGPRVAGNFWPWALAVGLLGLLVWAAIVVYVPTSAGVVRIEVNDPDTRLVLEKGKIEIKGKKTEKITIKPGKQSLWIERGDFSFETKDLVLKDGDTITVAVSLLEGKVTLSHNGVPIRDEALGGQSQPQPPSVKVAGEPKSSPPPPPAADPDRAAVEWIVSIGGSATVRTEYGESRRVNRLIDVPRDPFRLIECWLVSNSEATDQGLAWLAGCRDLERLYLQGTPVTDAGLAHFKNCARLTHLHLFGTALTDAGLAHFSGCENLKELQISLTKATDAGLAHIRSYRQLDRLNLHGTRVTDRGLAHFKDCRQLSYLNLKSLAGVTDAGLANFKDCTALQAVVLEETQVSDASIEMLIQRAPKELYLRQTKVSSEGLTKLIAALPDCKFDIEPLDAPPQSNPMADRKAAEWVLAVGGHVEVVIAPNRRIRVTKPAALPEEPFKLVVCDLSYFRAILGNTRHEDAALACFEGCVDLEELWINGWPLRKGSMAPFRQCKKLTILQLYDTGVTDDGLALFRDHQRLKHVNLARSNVSEAALIEFIRGRTFELLALPPKATDACIDEVIRTNPSKQLSLQGTAITEDGRKRLAAALPQCRIEWDDGVIGPRTR